MTLYEYADMLYRTLDIGSFQDLSLNGVQIGAEDRELKKVAFAVDACQETISRAVEEKADILVVHHGLFWGHPLAIDGEHRKRVKKALDGGLMLFACHLPLDANVPYGNNAQMASLLGVQDMEMFSQYKGRYLGVKGTLPRLMSISEISRILDFKEDENRIVYGGKKDGFRKVAILSGSGSGEALEAADEGADLYITGEVEHQDYHPIMERGITVLAGGHYRTEVFGVKALKALTEKEVGVETVFLSVETGL